MKIIKQRQFGASGLELHKGLLEQMKDVKPIHYDTLTIKDVENALKQMTIGRVGSSKPALLVSDFQYRYYNATINNDEKELKVLNAEMFANWTRTTKEMSEKYKLDYDLVYLLRKKYRWYGDSFEVQYINTSDINNEYDDSFEVTKLYVVEDKFLLRSYKSDGYSSDLVNEVEIKKEDLFNKLIVN